ncbi:hypothetical protein [Streptomyces sp. NPDC005435]
MAAIRVYAVMEFGRLRPLGDVLPQGEPLRHELSEWPAVVPGLP